MLSAANHTRYGGCLAAYLHKPDGSEFQLALAEPGLLLQDEREALAVTRDLDGQPRLVGLEGDQVLFSAPLAGEVLELTRGASVLVSTEDQIQSFDPATGQPLGAFATRARVEQLGQGLAVVEDNTVKLLDARMGLAHQVELDFRPRKLMPLGPALLLMGRDEADHLCLEVIDATGQSLHADRDFEEFSLSLHPDGRLLYVNENQRLMQFKVGEPTAETLRWVGRGAKPVPLESGFLLEDDGKVEAYTEDNRYVTSFRFGYREVLDRLTATPNGAYAITRKYLDDGGYLRRLYRLDQRQGAQELYRVEGHNTLFEASFEPDGGFLIKHDDRVERHGADGSLVETLPPQDEPQPANLYRTTVKAEPLEAQPTACPVPVPQFHSDGHKLDYNPLFDRPRTLITADDDETITSLLPCYSGHKGYVLAGTDDGTVYFAPIEGGRPQAFELGSPVTTICQLDDRVVIASQAGASLELRADRGFSPWEMPAATVTPMDTEDDALVIGDVRLPIEQS
ncbi:MAG: hypothetical protein AB7S38_27270 [Vulcanimicrobiota bacterium]